MLQPVMATDDDDRRGGSQAHDGACVSSSE